MGFSWNLLLDNLMENEIMIIHFKLAKGGPHGLGLH
jgi:hypothetical protein